VVDEGTVIRADLGGSTNGTFSTHGYLIPK